MEVIKRLLGVQREEYRHARLVQKTATGQWLVEMDGKTSLVHPVTDEAVPDGAQVVVKDGVVIGARK